MQKYINKLIGRPLAAYSCIKRGRKYRRKNHIMSEFCIYTKILFNYFKILAAVYFNIMKFCNAIPVKPAGVYKLLPGQFFIYNIYIKYFLCKKLLIFREYFYFYGIITAHFTVWFNRKPKRTCLSVYKFKFFIIYFIHCIGVQSRLF